MKYVFSRVTVICFALLSSSILPPASAQEAKPWKQLLNGHDLTGWVFSAGRAGGAGQQAADAPLSWTAKDGVLMVDRNPKLRAGSVTTVDKYLDFELDLEFLLAERGTDCSEEFVDNKNVSKDQSCTFNGGISVRSGYQINLGRREAGEYIGVVIHRVSPLAIRGNVVWLDPGDKKFPGLRKKEDWNRLTVAFKGDHITVTLNGKEICDARDNPVLDSEASWKQPAPITIQYPPGAEGGDFMGTIKFRNIRVREL